MNIRQIITFAFLSTVCLACMADNALSAIAATPPAVQSAVPCELTVTFTGQSDTLVSPVVPFMGLTLKNVSTEKVEFFTPVKYTAQVFYQKGAHGQWVQLKSTLPAISQQAPPKGTIDLDSDNSTVFIELTPGTTWTNTLTLADYDMSAPGLYRINVTMSPKQFWERAIGTSDHVTLNSPKYSVSFQSNTITIERTRQKFQNITHVQK